MLDIFVISPYTHADKKIEAERAHQADLYIGHLMQQDKVAYSTISAMHHLLDKCKLPGDWEYWKKHCEMMISSAHEVHVLCLYGWDESKGVADELAFAKMFPKKIKLITPMSKDDARVYITSDI